MMYIEIAKIDVSLKMPFMHEVMTSAVGSFIATDLQTFDEEDYPEGITTKKELKDFLIQQAFDRILAEIERIEKRDEISLQDDKFSA
jgi:hypothetical protein